MAALSCMLKEDRAHSGAEDLHESVETTQMYLDTDLELKQKLLDQIYALT